MRTGPHAQRRRPEHVQQLSLLRRDAEAVSRGSAGDFGATESTACCHVAAHTQDDLAEVNKLQRRNSQLLRGVGLHRGAEGVAATSRYRLQKDDGFAKAQARTMLFGRPSCWRT